MSTVLDETKVKRIAAPEGLTELVRGNELELVAQLEPVVREQSIALDLHGVTRIDAAGIAALISLYGRAQDAGHMFMVCNVTPRVTEILTLVGLDHILVTHDVVPTMPSGTCFGNAAA